MAGAAGREVTMARTHPTVSLLADQPPRLSVADVPSSVTQNGHAQLRNCTLNINLQFASYPLGFTATRLHTCRVTLSLCVFCCCRDNQVKSASSAIVKLGTSILEHIVKTKETQSAVRGEAA